MARLSLVLGSLAVVLLVVAALTSGGLGPLTITPAVAVTPVGPTVPLVRSHEAPSLVVDHDKPDVLYLADVELRSGACQFSVSVDGGATWAPETAPSLPPYTSNCGLGSSQPHNVRTDLAQGSDGTLYYAFQGNDPGAGGTRSVLVGRSSDGGRSWAVEVVYAGPRATTPSAIELNFQAHVTVDPERPHRLYVTWRRSYPSVEADHEGRLTRSYLAVSDDGGQSFGPARLLFDRVTGPDGPRLLAVDGTLYAFYIDATPNEAIPEPSPTPRGVIVSAAISSDAGRTWDRRTIAEAPSASEPDPVYDPERGRFSVVWHDNREDELDVYFSSSADGRSWSPPRRLNDDVRGTRVGQHYPQVSISPAGRLDVAWYDWRDDPFPAPADPGGGPLGLFSNRGRLAAVYLTSSDDGGETWRPNLRVSDVPIDRTIGTWATNFDVLAPLAVASTPRRAVVAWSDTRQGTDQSQSQDIYSAVVGFPVIEGKAVGTLQAALVGLFVGASGAMWAALRLIRRRRRPVVRGPQVRRLLPTRQAPADRATAPMA